MLGVMEKGRVEQIHICGLRYAHMHGSLSRFRMLFMLCTTAFTTTTKLASGLPPALLVMITC
jgi:hypothetical protein